MPGLISVIIANHNYGHWLTDAINSVVAQDYENKQIIVVNNGCTDDSVDVLCDMIGVHPASLHGKNKFIGGKHDNVPLFFYNEPNPIGPSAARNIGIKFAWRNTSYFGMLDADDTYKPNKISKSLAKLEGNQKYIGAIYSDYDTVDENGIFRREYKEPFSRGRLVQECIVHSACIVTREALENCGLYAEDLRCCEDFDLWLRISEKFLITHIPESLMTVRVHSGNSTNSVKSEVWQECMMKVQQRLKERNGL